MCQSSSVVVCVWSDPRHVPGEMSLELSRTVTQQLEHVQEQEPHWQGMELAVKWVTQGSFQSETKKLRSIIKSFWKVFFFQLCAAAEGIQTDEIWGDGKSVVPLRQKHFDTTFFFPPSSWNHFIEFITLTFPIHLTNIWTFRRSKCGVPSSCTPERRKPVLRLQLNTAGYSSTRGKGNMIE